MAHTSEPRVVHFAGERCDQCRFWECKPTPVDDTHGICRRFAPRVVYHIEDRTEDLRPPVPREDPSLWPSTMGNDWCGDFVGPPGGESMAILPPPIWRLIRERSIPVTSLRDLSLLSIRELLTHNRVGRKTIARARRILGLHGLDFPDTADYPVICAMHCGPFKTSLTSPSDTKKKHGK